MVQVMTLFIVQPSNQIIISAQHVHYSRWNETLRVRERERESMCEREFSMKVSGSPFFIQVQPSL